MLKNTFFLALNIIYIKKIDKYKKKYNIYTYYFF